MLAIVLLLLLAAAWVLTASGRPAPRASAGRRVRWRSVASWWRGRAVRRGHDDVTRVLVQVATRLRAGAPLAEAWRRALPDPTPVWAAEVLVAAGSEAVPGAAGHGPAPPVGPLRRWRRDRTAQQGADVAAAVAACRLAARTGAPLAEVIDVVVGGIGEAAEAEEQRRTALAGPRATARLLAWLPAGGIALGTMLGADPLGVLLGGGVGGLCLVAGGALFVLGRRWVRGLVADAERAGR